MTPGLAFFYGGMVRGKSVLNMMMMSFGAMGVVGVIWVLWGYPMAFGTDIGGFMGNPFDGFGLGNCIAANPEAVAAVDGLRRLPGDLRDHHRRADLRCDRRPDEVQRLARVHRRLGHPGLLPDRALGLGRRRLDLQARRDRLRRWNRRAHQRRYRGPGAGDHPRQAQGLGQGPDASAQPAVRDARRRPAVVRLVRLQRRLGARRRRHGRRWCGSTRWSRPVPRCSAGS